MRTLSKHSLVVLAIASIMALAACHEAKAASAYGPLVDGSYLCRDSENLGTYLQVVRNSTRPDKINIRWQRRKPGSPPSQIHTLHVIPDTMSGAVRYEGAGSGLVYIQIPEKSVLLNIATGVPVLTDCYLQ